MKAMYDIRNLQDIEQYRRQLHRQIAAKEKALTDDIRQVRTRWSLLTHVSSGIGTALRLLSPKAGYIMAGITLWQTMIRLFRRR